MLEKEASEAPSVDDGTPERYRVSRAQLQEVAFKAEEELQASNLGLT